MEMASKRHVPKYRLELVLESELLSTCSRRVLVDLRCKRRQDIVMLNVSSCQAVIIGRLMFLQLKSDAEPKIYTALKDRKSVRALRRDFGRYQGLNVANDIFTVLWPAA